MNYTTLQVFRAYQVSGFSYGGDFDKFLRAKNSQLQIVTKFLSCPNNSLSEHCIKSAKRKRQEFLDLNNFIFKLILQPPIPPAMF